jgi:cytochrome b subunit of formate dehydrogenase
MMNKFLIFYVLSVLLILIASGLLMWAQDDSSVVDNEHFAQIRKVAYGLLACGMVLGIGTFIMHMRS